jgi:hypothetical protein
VPFVDVVVFGMAKKTQEYRLGGRSEEVVTPVMGK